LDYQKERNSKPKDPGKPTQDQKQKISNLTKREIQTNKTSPYEEIIRMRIIEAINLFDSKMKEFHT
jgi:hypothetical protein